MRRTCLAGGEVGDRVPHDRRFSEEREDGLEALEGKRREEHDGLEEERNGTGKV